MEHAARLLKNKKLSREILNEEDIARAVWPAAVGKAIAAHTSRLKLVRSTLVVEVEDAIWQKQLHTLTGQILNRLRKATGSDNIVQIEFRIGIPRREPQRADSRKATVPKPGGLLEDDANGIQDPVLQKIYRLSRKKATA